jgi:cytochrome bd-type quinol oxidase subunit 2
MQPMKSLKALIINRKFRSFYAIKSLIRRLLYFSIICISVSCLITLIIGSLNSYPINYFLVFGILFILVFSVIIMVMISIYYKIVNEKIWDNVKNETSLIIVMIVILLILYLINNLKNDY